MKTTRIISALMVASAIMCAVPASAQELTQAQQNRQERKAEKKAAKTRRQQKKELYAKSEKAARKEARKLEKQGWKSMELPIAKMLEKTWELEFMYGTDGMPTYIYVTTQATGQSFSAAQMEAENVAKVRIISKIASSVSSLSDIALANQEIDAATSASLQKVVENSKSFAQGKLGRLFTPLVIYRQNKTTYDVRMTVVYDTKQAVNAYVETVKEQLEKDSDKNRAQLEALLGMDKIVDNVEKMNIEE